MLKPYRTIQDVLASHWVLSPSAERHQKTDRVLGGVMLATSIMLWYLDSFFLTAEKNYRQIYSWILRERPNGDRQLQYELDFNKYESEAKLSRASQRDVAFSKTLNCFYGMPTIISFIYLAVQLVLSCSN